jgi:2-keto-4-pentenoate hydratase/2-oxohepta-3-ene-1,7-dioic acid hydratase in catechol pathway
MKLVTFYNEGTQSLGVKTHQGILDVNAALNKHPSLSAATNVMEVITGGKAAILSLEQLVDKAAGQTELFLDEEGLELGPCVSHPNKIICVGLNYGKHAEETNAAIPEFPILFNKFNNTLTAHKKEIKIPKVTEKLDYEAELVIVIGKKAKYIPEEEAMNCIFGYCNVNDLSARDLQLRTPQWLLGKTCDDFSPLGPYLVTADEIDNPNNLEIKSIVNGEVRQHSNTSDMIFNCEQIVSYISQHMTLVPGDIILTGTPEGVVLGKPVDQQIYLKDGDVVKIEIEKLGSLMNHFSSE